jgi:hypothetical protein
MACQHGAAQGKTRQNGTGYEFRPILQRKMWMPVGQPLARETLDIVVFLTVSTTSRAAAWFLVHR